jgi:hypothetical protein
MCPVCIATAALIAGKVTSAGGLAAIAIRKFGVKNAVDKNPAQRRNQDVNKHDGETPNSLAR